MHSYTWNHKHVIFECDHYKNVWYLMIDINILWLDIYAKWHELCPLCSVPIFLTSSLHELIYILYLLSYVLFPPSCFFLNIFTLLSLFFDLCSNISALLYTICVIYIYSVFCVLCLYFVFCVWFYVFCVQWYVFCFL